MKKVFLVLAILSLASMGFGKDWKYPELSYGKKIVTKNSVETSYGTLNAYGLRANDNRYMIWELAEGNNVIRSVFLKLNGKRWQMRIGKEEAVIPVSQNDIISGKMQKKFPWIKRLIKSAEEASQIAKTKPSILLSYSLYFFLTGEKPLHNLFVNSSGNIINPAPSAISCDQCNDILNECMANAEVIYRMCINHCDAEITDAKENQKCKEECIKSESQDMKVCLEYWQKCMEKCSPEKK